MEAKWQGLRRILRIPQVKEAARASQAEPTTAWLS